MSLSSNNAVSLTMKHSNTSKFKILFERGNEWISFKPLPGLSVYPCYACRTMFSSKVSFCDHINRRSVVIKYNCSDCSSILLFYNRCSFILHTREHFSPQGGLINLSNVDIHLLPISHAGFTPIKEIPFLFDEEEDYCGESAIVNNKFYYADENDLGKVIVTMKPYNIVFYYNDSGMQKSYKLVLKQISKNIPHCRFITEEAQKARINLICPTIKQEPLYQEQDNNVPLPIISKIESLNNGSKCPECHKEVDVSVAYHFIGPNKPQNLSWTCCICKFIAPTECSYKAHVRVHTGAPPFICPECGVDCESNDALLKHIEEICFHLSKQIRFKCPASKCGKLFVVHKTYALHVANHIQIIKSCNICGKSFEKQSDFMKHALDQHKSTPAEVRQSYICTICNSKKEITEKNYMEHINFHATNRQLCVYIFCCKYCRSQFRTSATYSTHKHKCTKSSDTTKLSYHNGKCNYCGYSIIFRDKDVFRTCLLCKRGNYNLASMAAAEEKEKNNKEQNSKENENDGIQTKNVAMVTPTVKKKYIPCILCKEIISVENRREHLKNCRYNNPIVHVKREKETSKRPKDNNNKEQDRIPRKKRKSPNAPIKVNRLQPEEPKIEKIILNTEGMYICRLCNYKKPEKADFHNHIMTHRNISTAYQCMDCGECFVVKPSLVKHLVHYHKIKDVEDYFKNNDCFNKAAVQELENHLKFNVGEYRGPLNENQCSVCLKEFVNSTELEKHFRNHGLAYLLQKTK